MTVERECVRPRDGNVLAFRAYPRAHHPSLIPTVITCAMEAARAPRGWMRSKILIWEVVHIFGRFTFQNGSHLSTVSSHFWTVQISRRFTLIDGQFTFLDGSHF